MRFTSLGGTQLRIPRVGQGTMGIGGYFSAKRTLDADFIGGLQTGIEAGLTFIDTAEVYGQGHSEELVGLAIEGCRDRVFIATKVSPEHLSYENVLRAADASLARLKTDAIDLYQVHWPNPAIAASETMKAMRRLLEEGVVRSIGLCNFSKRAALLAQDALGKYRIHSNQVEYSLFDRSVESGLLSWCQAEHITFIAYSPLDKGRLFTDDARSARLKEIASRYGRTPAQISLNWLIAHDGVIAIPKAVCKQHILENAAAADFSLSQEDFDEIDNLFSRPLAYISPERIQADVDNLDRFTPGPEDLAGELLAGDPLKPIRVVRAETGNGVDYVLVEGKLRYWAWVSAFGINAPIPALVRGE